MKSSFKQKRVVISYPHFLIPFVMLLTSHCLLLILSVSLGFPLCSVHWYLEGECLLYVSVRMCTLFDRGLRIRKCLHSLR